VRGSIDYFGEKSFDDTCRKTVDCSTPADRQQWSSRYVYCLSAADRRSWQC